MLQLQVEVNNMYVEARDILTGEIHKLILRNNRNNKQSNCLFFEPFCIGPYKIQHRLDLQDTNEWGDPTLDADIYNAQTGKKIKTKRMERIGAKHHTKPEINENGRIYSWIFKDTVIHYKIIFCYPCSITETAQASDVVSCKVNKKENIVSGVLRQFLP